VVGLVDLDASGPGMSFADLDARACKMFRFPDTKSVITLLGCNGVAITFLLAYG